LELLSGVRGGALWGVLSEELLGSGSLGLGFLGEGLVSDGGFDGGDVDLEAGAEGVDLVDSLERDTVDLVWAGDGEEAGLELLEADDSLSSESSSEEDEDGSWGNGCSQLWGFWSVSLWGLLGGIICWVPVVFLNHLSSKKEHKKMSI